MNSLYLKFICLFLALGCAHGKAVYKIISQFSKATQASFVIDGESGDFNIELKFDEHVSAMKVT